MINYFIDIVPSRAPTNVKATSNGPFTTFVEWTGVHQNDMNGIPLGYHIYAELNGVIQSSNSTAFDQSSIIMYELEPSTSYVFLVCAYNSAGDGPCDL